MNFMRLFHNLERVEQFKTRYQKHYANDEDELERYGFFKKSKTRFTKHDDQSKEHHHERENLDHCEVDAWWFDPCVLLAGRLGESLLVTTRKGDQAPT